MLADVAENYSKCKANKWRKYPKRRKSLRNVETDKV